MEPDQSGGQMDVGLNAEMTRVTEESGGSGSNQMAMLQMQLRITEMELAMERLRNENGARAAAAVQSTEADRSEDRRLRYTSLLKDVLVPMPTQESLVPSWFDDVEATFDCYDVPGEWRAGLVLPRLSEKARGLLVRLSADERKDYYVLKEAVLKGLRLSSSEYRRLFTQSKKRGDETWSQFAIRLEIYLIYYLNGYRVSSVEEFRNLVVTDRLRDTLGAEARSFVIQNEAPAKIMLPLEIAELAESFEESRRGMTNSSEVARGERPNLNSEARRSPTGAGKTLSGAGDSQATPINKPELAEECGGRHGSPTASAKFVCKCAPELKWQWWPEHFRRHLVHTWCGSGRLRQHGRWWRLPPPTSSGPRFMTWGARYSRQPRWPAATMVVRVNELWLKTPLAELEQTPYIGVLRRDCRDWRGDDQENAPSAHRK
ncbi:hypothetical protein HPB50_014569 [Hyalomma asiaticum]|uniref:Uncharacterized protein n=1 Tax=Hyalomma asiaticum TaxID=266040 RepID=A0ACB7S7L4_HYAAI|nr:hypothetical protein HPB50_014569 [Hyalomma asiaticum]